MKNNMSHLATFVKVLTLIFSISETVRCNDLPEGNYHFSEDLKSQNDARQSCMGMGMQLFEPKDQDELDIVRAHGEANKAYWLGIAQKETEVK